MKRGKKLDAGNFPSWKERIDYQLECALDRGRSLRETDLDLYSKVGALEGRVDRTATNKDLIATRATVNHLVNVVGILAVLVLALLVFAVWSVLG